MIIHKYALYITTPLRITVPIRSKPICVMVQSGTPTVWVMKDDSHPLNNEILITVVPTGVVFDTPHVGEYLGSFEGDGWFIGHVFWRVI